MEATDTVKIDAQIEELRTERESLKAVTEYRENKKGQREGSKRKTKESYQATQHRVKEEPSSNTQQPG